MDGFIYIKIVLEQEAYQFYERHTGEVLGRR